MTIDIHTARPGIVIGKSGSEVDALRKELHAMTHKNVQVNIVEVETTPSSTPFWWLSPSPSSSRTA